MDKIQLNEKFIKSEKFSSLIVSNVAYYRKIFLLLNKPMMELIEFKEKNNIALSGLSAFEKDKITFLGLIILAFTDKKIITRLRELNKAIPMFGSFNIWAMFFGPFWFIYRKMYQAGILFFIIIMMPVSNIALLFMFTFIGFVANQVYYISIYKKLKNLISSHDISDIGGTNLGAAVAACFIGCVITYSLEMKGIKSDYANYKFLQCLQSSRGGTDCVGELYLNSQ